MDFKEAFVRWAVDCYDNSTAFRDIFEQRLDEIMKLNGGVYSDNVWYWFTDNYVMTEEFENEFLRVIDNAIKETTSDINSFINNFISRGEEDVLST